MKLVKSSVLFRDGVLGMCGMPLKSAVTLELDDVGGNKYRVY